MCWKVLVVVQVVAVRGFLMPVGSPVKTKAAPLFAVGPPWAPPMRDSAFGVELELLRTKGTVKEDIRRSIMAAVNEEVISPEDENARSTTKAWKIVKDCSLSRRGFELVSPILSGHDGRHRLAAVIKRLNADNLVESNAKCGYHVHVGLTDINFKGVRCICQQWVKYEDGIDLLLAPSRRGNENRFCRSVRKNKELAALANKQAKDLIGSTRRIDELQDLINPITKEDPTGRYYKLNLRTGKRNTIEFRAHGGTTDVEEIKRWINFLVSFVTNTVRDPSEKSFKDSQTPEYIFHRLFAWVARGKTMYNFYVKRANRFRQKQPLRRAA